MKGVYSLILKENNEIVDSRIIENTITTAGRQLLFNWLTDNADQFLEHIGVGLSSTAATAGDTDLGHEIMRKEIESEVGDVANNKIHFYTNFYPEEANGVIEEVGVFDQEKGRDNFILADFNLDSENWNVGVTDETNFKEGESALKVTASANATTTTSLPALFDLSEYEDTDKFNLYARPTNVANLTSIQLRMETDASNYFGVTLSSFSANVWNLKSTAKSAFTSTGTPSWSNITSIKLITTMSAGSSSDITFDSLRLVTSDTSSTLFSRQVVSPAVVKNSNQELFALYELSII